MALITPSARESLASLRAVKTVVTRCAPIAPVQRSAMELAQRHFLSTDHDIDQLAPISPEELAAELTSPALRRQLVQVMCAYVMLGQDIRPEHIEAISGYARAFGLDEPAVDQLRYLIEDRIRWLKFDFRRRGAVGDALKQAYKSSGVRGVLDTVLQIAGHGEDAELTARFTRLAELPDGTLGRELLRFYQDRGFSLPGEKHGTPMPLVPHDLVHILAGYDTDVLGEVRTLSFQTGFKRDNPLMFMFLLLFQLQLGVEMVQLVPGGAGSYRGFFDDPQILAEVWKAQRRGAAMNRDLMDGTWDYWSVLDRPVEELRARYNVPPA